jgi:hypothetical protein
VAATPQILSYIGTTGLPRAIVETATFLYRLPGGNLIIPGSRQFGCLNSDYADLLDGQDYGPCLSAACKERTGEGLGVGAEERS